MVTSMRQALPHTCHHKELLSLINAGLQGAINRLPPNATPPTKEDVIRVEAIENADTVTTREEEMRVAR
jgi:hypothetical protein